jgi:hypothetical protein
MRYITQCLNLLGIWCALACVTASAAGFHFCSDEASEFCRGGVKGRVLLYNPYVFVATTNDGPWRSGSITPFSASFRVYAARSGRLVTSFSTHAPGRFRVSLPPGDYRVVPQTMFRGQVLPPRSIVLGHTQSARPFNIEVRPLRFTAVKVTYWESMGY